MWVGSGPFVGFRTSTDFGATWNEPHYKMSNGSDNIFHESVIRDDGALTGKVKFGAPHVVDFGQNMKYSPDGKMYIVGHGSTRASSAENWYFPKNAL